LKATFPSTSRRENSISSQNGGKKLLSVKKWKCDDNARWFYLVAFYAIFANLPFWAACPAFGLQRNGWFCLEYAAVGLLALFVPGILAAALLLLVIAADMICAISRTYYLPPAECLKNLGTLRDLSGLRLLTVAEVVILTVLVTVIASMLPSAKIRGACRMRAAACLIVFAVMLMFMDYATIVRATGQSPNPFRLVVASDSVKLSYLERPRFSRPALILLVHEENMLFGLRAAENAFPREASAVPSAAAAAIRLAGLTANGDTQQKSNLVVILVESWGLANDSLIRDGLAQPYFLPDLLAKYRVLQGTVPFYGPTIAGEARELCGSRMGFHLLDASTEELQGCLPGQLAAQGYHTMALHGMDGHMFDRLTWYGNIRFQDEWFRDRFRQQGLADCADVFNGTCDAAIAEWIGRRLEAGDANPDFVYWVTVNSHLPVPTPAPLADGASCSVTPFLSQQPALCSWYQLVSNVHRSVAELALTKFARPTVFAIVGDHAPPFAAAALRDQFSGVVVPYVLLVPRQP
jgi:hypothetical protein